PFVGSNDNVSYDDSISSNTATFADSSSDNVPFAVSSDNSPFDDSNDNVSYDDSISSNTATFADSSSDNVPFAVSSDDSPFDDSIRSDTAAFIDDSISISSDTATSKAGTAMHVTHFLT
ncbi:hypothetical protein PF008_g25217, partial [Phytophthora fragariae]